MKYLILIIIILLIFYVILGTPKYYFINKKYNMTRDKVGYSKRNIFNICNEYIKYYKEHNAIPANQSDSRQELEHIYRAVFSDNNIPIDPYKSSRIFFESDGWRPGYKSGYWGDYYNYYSDGKTYVLVFGYGPDKKQDINYSDIHGIKKFNDMFNVLLNKCYDPTNGTISEGDIYQIKELNESIPENNNQDEVPQYL